MKTGVKKGAKRLQNAESAPQFFSVLLFTGRETTSLLKFVTYQLVRAGKRAHVKSQFVRLVFSLGIRKKVKQHIFSKSEWDLTEEKCENTKLQWLFQRCTDVTASSRNFSRSRLRAQALDRPIVFKRLKCEPSCKKRCLVYHTLLNQCFLIRGMRCASKFNTRDSLRLPFCLTVLGIALTFISFGSRTLTRTSSPVPILFGELVKNPYFELHMNFFPLRFKLSSKLNSSSLYCLKAFCISPPGWLMLSLIWSKKLTNIRHCLSPVNHTNRPSGQSCDSCGGKESGFKPYPSRESLLYWHGNER